MVGAHFLTDIIGGVLVAFLCFKFINLFLDNKFIYLKPKTLIKINQNLFFCIFIILSLLAILLTILLTDRTPLVDTKWDKHL